MRSFFLPIFCIAAAVVIFFVPTRKALQDTEPLTQKRTDLELALTNAKKIQTVRESLQSQYASFKQDDLNRLEKMVPIHVDNVRLVIDINNMASAYGMTLKDIQVEQAAEPSESPTPGALVGDTAEHLDLRFTVSGTYEALKLLLGDLGKSLRIVDITDIAFSSKESDTYDFAIGLRTYWLQDK